MFNSELSYYMAVINRIPLLSNKEEYKLSYEFRNSEDKLVRVKAKNALIEANLRFVVKISNKFKGYINQGKVSLMDLIQEGNTGLIKAIEKFDPTKGYKLSTYAVWWIKASIQKYIISQYSIVKLGTTRAQRILFFKIGTLKDIAAINNPIEKSAALEYLAETLNLTIDDIIEMQSRTAYSDLSLNIDSSKKDNNKLNFIDLLGDDNKYQDILEEKSELFNFKIKLKNSMNSLSDREKEIINLRWLSGDKVTLETLGKNYGISRERIRQIEKVAFEKIKKEIQSKFSEELINQLF